MSAASRASPALPPPPLAPSSYPVVTCVCVWNAVYGLHADGAWNLAAVKRQIYGITGVPCTKQVLHYADAQLCDAYDGDSEPPSIPAGAELRAVAVHHVGRSFQVFVKTLTVRKRARVRVQCGGLTVSCCGRGQQ